MQYRKIFGPLRISSPAGQPTDIPLPATPGGRFCKDVQFMILVTDESGDNARVGIKLNQGPTRDTTFHNYNTPIPSGDPGEIPAVMVGDTTGSAAMLGEWLQPILRARRNMSDQVHVVVRG